eukprot:CAMPEP_0173449138 /NCGR_PEP_ID=MMETSP1357-20121228/42195_1 /TAXON_ID=77926 /ORGANISM="Hemiselmis rufescens, Strain PCC563" /LENGTH=293 /DNA_ID=CAMNT_0014415705 /DNA_START=71 /DNA_END=952 /DNA_ORIENTATION=+
MAVTTQALLLLVFVAAADSFSPSLLGQAASRGGLRKLPLAVSPRPQRSPHTLVMQQKTPTDASSPVKDKDAAASDLDLCTIEGSFCEPGEVEKEGGQGGGFSYGEFARQQPFANNIIIATAKSGAADLLAQTVLQQTPLDSVDWTRSLLFCTFGAVYLGAFQYAYQVNVFKKLFDVDKFTTQPWGDKLKDGPGLRALAAQTALDLTVLTLVYLPTFYIFKAGVFSGSADPGVWASTGFDNYVQNFAKDEFDLIRVWLPADLVCFSVPLYLRLPVRHIVSFVWTAYLSFARGGH